MTPAACRFPGDDHEGDLQPIAVANLPALGVTALELVYLCAKHVAVLAADVPTHYAPARSSDVPTWVLDELLKMAWPLDSELFPELLAARSRADLPPAERAALEQGPPPIPLDDEEDEVDLDLELGLDAILVRYGIPPGGIGADRRADRGDLASDLADLAREFHRRRSPGPADPPWHLTRQAIPYLEKIVADRGPGGLSDLDQLRSIIRDEVDKLELSVHDPWTLYVGLVWTGMITELARNGMENGRVSLATYETVAEIVTTIAAALLDYLPPEARP